MAFVSINYIVFLPIVVLVYYILPNRFRYIWLLIASYYFYMNWNAKYAILLFASSLATYLSGLFLGRIDCSDNSSKTKKKRKKTVVIICIAINLGILFIFKYLNFTIGTINKLLENIGRENFLFEREILLPVGISFYTFQAIGYVIDVYRGDITYEKNFLKYALFVSFFPQLVAGPIERSKNLLPQLNVPKVFDYDGFREGVLIIIWGYFIKMVIADRAAIFVDNVYNAPFQYGGVYLIVATVLFGLQIYCDFAGYSCIAIGSAKLLGIELMTNFKSPYLSETVSSFWRNWHISLNTWFKDYLYIPLGGNRKGKVRQYINIMIVFILSGLWHGANWTYVIWGGLNGLYQIISRSLAKPRQVIKKALGINSDLLGNRIISIAFTFILVDIAWIFFRVEHVRTAFDILRSMITDRNLWILWSDELYGCGLDRRNFGVMIFSVMILMLVDVLNKRGLVIRKIVLKQDYWFRCIAVAISVAFVLLFGIWGSAYDAKSFIYFQF